MVDLCEEDYHRGTKRIIFRKLDLELENTSGVRTIRRAKDNTFPEEHIVSNWTSTTVHRRIPLKIK
jgi:hypothetical protein